MTDVLWVAAAPTLAFLLDTLLGDPHSSRHPVVLIGRLISALEKILYPRSGASDARLFWRGAAVVVLVIGIVGVLVWALTAWAKETGPAVYAAVSAVILYFTISPRALLRDGMAIVRLLKDGNLPEARHRLSWIVGRDTDHLEEPDIARGVVETVAENTTDGVLSPLFWFLLAGPVGAACYRAANTMDSMLGYKNERYLFFGRVAARLDDVLNYIPARLTFLFFVAASALLGYDAKNAWRIGLRDAKKHPSPNGGYAEAPTAGALHVRLGGWNFYEGKPEFREYMGDADRPLVAADIAASVKMMYVATILFLLCMMGIFWMGHTTWDLFWWGFSF